MEARGNAQTLVEPRLLTVDDVARRLNFAPKTIYANAEVFGAVHIGRSLRFRPEVIERIAEKGTA